MEKICCFCNKLIAKEEKFSFLVGAYSHKFCDNKYFKEQEKRVEYLYKSQEERGEF